MPTELLSIQPSELLFPFELKKQVSCSLRLINLTEHYVAYKVKTTSPKKYCVRPNTGIVSPQSSTDITVTMQAQREAPPDLQCKDKFLIQSVIAPYGISGKDVSQELFNKEPGKDICETKLRAVFVPPPQPPSPVLESAEEGLSPKASYSLDNGDQNTFFADTNSKEVNELRAKLTEARASLTSLTEERNAALRKTEVLQQELAQVLASKSKAETARSHQRLLQASLDGLGRVLLDGGPSRVFSQADAKLVEEDLQILKEFFMAGGDGIPRGVVENAASPVQQILKLYSLETHAVIENMRHASEQMAAGTNAHRNGNKTATDADTILRVLCHRPDSEASNFLKKQYKLPKSAG